MSAFLKLHDQDNVALALDDLPAGAEVHGVRVQEPIPAGHKVALVPLEPGAPIRKYAQIIGFASTAIAPGTHVHTHNCDVQTFSRDYAFGSEAQGLQRIEPPATFDGFLRADGRAGTRNFIAVLTSVNCSATVAKAIAAQFSDAQVQAEFPNVDGVVAFTHGTGCGQNIKGEGLALLRRVLSGYATHPNVAGALVVGLGCEVNQIPDFLKAEGLKAGPGLRTLVIQESGGTRKTVEEGVALVREMLQEANQCQRQPLPASYLTLALQCGGSDAYSGITANPALGAASDLLVRHGGTTVLSETPEIYGAEHLLTRRAASEDVGRKLIERIHWWEEYTARHGGEMDNNPSPGNKAGGLTTILEKSLGAVAKGGRSDLADVALYAERLRTHGFIFMDSPGYDPVSITGQVASGCNVVCFTTGRGSVYGCKPAPSLKLATNTPMFQRLFEDMDLNCGEVLEGVSVEKMGERIFQLILETASGKRTRSEQFGFGDYEFLPWQIGAVM